MSDESVGNLHSALDCRYGHRVQPYGSTRKEEHGFGFTVQGIPATFSAVTRDGTLPLNRFDVQIESLPPGNYLYTAEIGLEEFLNLIELFAGPPGQWP
jgi:hypothetical protein